MSEPVRLAVRVEGTVQGVGFRPFVHRIATARGLVGWVCNGAEGVRIEVQGRKTAVEGFLAELRACAPPRAVIEQLEAAPAVVDAGEVEFRIVPSQAGGAARPALPPDLHVCPDCLAEVRDPAARRHAYPFTNCTQCGPRYTIVTGLPYDRPATSMAGFAMCAACRAEYEDPADRRFHAQPIACADCGPRLALRRPDGTLVATGAAALAAAVHALESGDILALKGLGGFQLLVDARDAAAVARLRVRKRRPEKPFAVMFPDLAAVEACCEVSAAEAELLASPEAPIVLLRRHGPGVADEVAPGNPRLGVMLPTTPLHALLVRQPVVCTSGNLSDEPICTDDAEALARLGAMTGGNRRTWIADHFLSHDRPIVRPLDDSVVRLDAPRVRPRLLRRARGYTPTPVPVSPTGPTVLALGGHQKATVTLRLADRAIVSQHLGDLGSLRAEALLERTARELLGMYHARPAAIACDLHPDYASTRLAEALATEYDLPLVRVQHHHAHAAAVVAEHRLEGPVLGLAWDGTGFGADGTVWGGEAIALDGRSWRRIGHLRPFPLPGGDAASRDPRRAALGLLAAGAGLAVAREVLAGCLSPRELEILGQALARGVNAPLTSSIGRLFDAVAAIAELQARPGFEGQAAMAVEFAAEQASGRHAPYPLALTSAPPAPQVEIGRGPHERAVVADWAPLLGALLADRQAGIPPATMAMRFHLALAELAAGMAAHAGLPRVVLAGGCFQNALLSALVRRRLEAAGHTVYEAERLPPNDGGLSLGQAHVAALEVA